MGAAQSSAHLSAPGRGRSGPLPLVIGITGHRDLRPDGIGRLEDQVHQILADYQRRYCHTPVVLLSALAEGADQLGARAALAMGVRLVAVLPMPRELYQRDFASEAVLAEFQRLVDQARPCIELPLLSDRAAVEQDRAARDRQYAAAGAYIVRHSQVLIALWDGQDTGLTGGTASVVRFQLEGVPVPYGPAHSPLDAVESGPVHHVITPRARDSTPLAGAYQTCLRWPKDVAWEPLDDAEIEDEAFGVPEDSRPGKAIEAEFDRIFSRMDAFNADAVANEAALADQRQLSRRYLLGDEPPGEGVRARTQPSVLELFVVSDTLALHFQRRASHWLRLLFIIAAASALALDVYAHVLRHWLVLVVYLAFLAFAVGWFSRREHVTAPDKYLDYRALAEALRVQFFWGLAGLREAVADHYLSKQRGELRWIRNAAHAALLPWASQPTDVAGAVAAPDYGYIVRHWVEDQHTYFHRAMRRDAAQLRRARRWGIRLLLVGIGVAALMLVVFHGLAAEAASTELENDPRKQFHDVVIFVVALFPLLAAGWEGYADKKAYAEQAKQYRRMYDLYARAQAHLVAALSAGDTPLAERIVRDLGREALAENADWVVLHRGRVPELPVGA